jgi:hypothetical protein
MASVGDFGLIRLGTRQPVEVKMESTRSGAVACQRGGSHCAFGAQALKGRRWTRILAGSGN